MILLVLSIISIIIAFVQSALFTRNLSLYLVDTNALQLAMATSPTVLRPQISVLIPARNEEIGIGETIHASLDSVGVDLEVIVLDDHSTDATANIVQRLANNDPRVRYLPSAQLPPGWNGKQHACLQLSNAATFDRMVFLDADVRLAPTGLWKLASYQDHTGVALLSAFPQQITGTFMEKWLIPMMHYILLCFLPFSRMRSSNHPSYAAGCGQVFMTKRCDYIKAGTHAAIRSSRHDGLKLPRAYREQGRSTDVIDGSELAQCRMYSSAHQVIQGVLKNADEGIANAKLIVPFTIMLIGGSVLPLVLITLWSTTSPDLSRDLAVPIISVGALVLSHLPRIILAVRLGQSWCGVIFHSLAVLIFVALQWIAMVNHLLGRQVAWRGRRETQRPSTT